MKTKLNNYEYYRCIKCNGYVVLPKGLSYDKDNDRKKMVCGVCELEEITESNKIKCRGCGETFENEEINNEGFCCEECYQIYENPRLLKL